MGTTFSPLALPLRTWSIKCCLLTGNRERSLYPKPLCSVFPRDLCHAPRRRWTRSCTFMASMDTIQGDAASYDPSMHYIGESSSSYPDEGTSSSYYGDAP